MNIFCKTLGHKYDKTVLDNITQLTCRRCNDTIYNVKLCKEHQYICFAMDASFCPICGLESTVYGEFCWGVKEREYIKQYFNHEINHDELHNLLRNGLHLCMVKSGIWEFDAAT